MSRKWRDLNVREELRKQWEKSPSAFYKYVTAYTLGDAKHPVGDSDLPTFAEGKFIEHGRPYYKLWPLIGEEFTHTSLSIAGQYINFPYPIYEVKLPKSSVIPLYDYYRAVMVVGFNRQDIEEFELFSGDTEFLRELDKYKVIKLIYLYWDSRTYPDGDKYDWAYIPITETDTLEDAINKLTSGEDHVKEERFQYKAAESFPYFKDLIRIICAVTMFAIGEHEMVLPDIETPIIDKSKLGRGKKLKVNLERLKRQHDQAIARCKGWLVGSEISLPVPEYVGSYSKRSGEVNELTHGHVRTGHMRWQVCGKDNKDRKLVFIRPTIVRPDLPLRHAHGYRIGDKYYKD